MKHFHNDWEELLQPEFERDYYQNLRELLLEEYGNFEIYPRAEEIFRALDLTSFESARVLLLGQDPYHGPGQAHGLAFSVKEGPLPPSLVNIYRELEDDTGFDRTPLGGDLTAWAKEGVLLLNTSLTVRRGQAASHQRIGWQFFTDAIMKILNEKEDPLVCMLWGAHARSKKPLLNNPQHLIIESPHPSPLSAYRGFFGSKPFTRTNDYLTAQGLSPIAWDRQS
ncbi:MAG: uracil-DNA glycosylase [Tissierellia bacterium]|nr:uracil-DNA glycosylase [Tissierellia bacterium]